MIFFVWLCRRQIFDLCSRIEYFHGRWVKPTAYIVTAAESLEEAHLILGGLVKFGADVNETKWNVPPGAEGSPPPRPLDLTCRPWGLVTL